MKEKKQNASIAAMTISFVLGQGLIFLMGSWLIAEDRLKLAKEFQIFVSIFSFAQQFTDLGSANRILPLLRSNSLEEVRDVLFGKAIVASFLSLVVGFLVIFMSGLEVNYFILFFCMIVSGGFFGLATYGVLEYKGRYWLIAFIQVLPWLIVLLAFFVLMLVDSEIYFNINHIFLLIPVCGFIVLISSGVISKEYIILPPKNLYKSIKKIIPYIGGQIVGQIWGRIVLVIILKSVPSSVFVLFGPMRQIHIGVILFFGIVVRSVVRSFSSNDNISHLMSNKLIKIILKLSFLISACAAFVSVVSNLSDIISYKWIYWMPIYISIFPVVYVQIKQFQVHAVCAPRLVAKTESGAFILNVVSFVLMGKFFPNWALGISESAPGFYWRYNSRRIM